MGIFDNQSGKSQRILIHVFSMNPANAGAQLGTPIHEKGTVRLFKEDTASESATAVLQIHSRRK